MSLHTDPQQMVRAYARRMMEIIHYDRTVSLSRRDLLAPQVRVTRSSTWRIGIDPWKNKSQLPLISGGVLADLIYGDQPVLINNLAPDPTDPGFEYLQGMRSLMAIPHYDAGTGLNMVLHMRAQPDAFADHAFPDTVLSSNLFGRATKNLVLSGELRDAYAALDRELNVVAQIQRSLLPEALPRIPGLNLAASYQTSRHAGGDYYDFFQLADGRWGILIADVSGHGAPAAVRMAILHAIAHAVPAMSDAPGRMLESVNHRLTRGYTGGRGVFVTAFYGVYDPAARTLRYASAGHNPPRVKRRNVSLVISLDQATSLPLGIEDEVAFTEQTQSLSCGDVLLLYTDGITEAWDPSGEMFGVERLDEIVSRCHGSADALVQQVLSEVEKFTCSLPATDDRTLLAAQVE